MYSPIRKEEKREEEKAAEREEEGEDGLKSNMQSPKEKTKGRLESEKCPSP